MFRLKGRSRAKTFVSVILLPLCFLSSLVLVGCDMFSKKPIEPTLKSILFMLPVHLEGEEGRFPYNIKGHEYTLYTIGMDKNNPNQERFTEKSGKGYKKPFAYDHQQRKVKHSLIRYHNVPDLFFEPDPNKSVIVFACLAENNQLYFISNDLCLYSCVDKELFSRQEAHDFLGVNVGSLRKRTEILLLRDQKYSMLHMVGEGVCQDYYEAWFCNSYPQWHDNWTHFWEQQQYREEFVVRRK